MRKVRPSTVNSANYQWLGKVIDLKGKTTTITFLYLPNSNLHCKYLSLYPQICVADQRSFFLWQTETLMEIHLFSMILNN